MPRNDWFSNDEDTAAAHELDHTDPPDVPDLSDLIGGGR